MIKISVDSASDIDKAEAEALGVQLIPMTVRFGETEYADGIDLSHRQFFEKLIESDELPQTSQINEFQFERHFKELTADGSEAVVITISSKLSGTYDCACRAAQNFGGRVHVVDSLNASVGERILCLHAVQLLKRKDMTAARLVEILNEQKTRIRVLALLGTLEYLKRGGRVSSTVAFVGELFSIKPVISITDGEVKLIGKAMGSKRGSNLLTQLIDKHGVDFDMPLALVYSGLSDELLDKYITDSKHLWEGKTQQLPRVMIGSAIGTHIGPGAIGVAFFAKKPDDRTA